MTNFPDPERYPVGSPEREAEQQRKNDLMRLAAMRLSASNPPASRAREDETMNSHVEYMSVSEALAREGMLVPRRERIATAAMAGFIARTEDDELDWTIPGRAIAMADRMITELDRKGEEG